MLTRFMPLDIASNLRFKLPYYTLKKMILIIKKAQDKRLVFINTSLSVLRNNSS